MHCLHNSVILIDLLAILHAHHSVELTPAIVVLQRLDYIILLVITTIKLILALTLCCEKYP